jgi:hypothetical protein
MSEYVVGKRDARQRKFLGWRVRRDDRCLQLAHDGRWYKLTRPFYTKELAVNTLTMSEEAHRHVWFSRVFALESPKRKALRELVEAASNASHISVDTLNAAANARKILEAW